MDKKAIIIGMVTLMLVIVTHLNVLGEQIKKDDSILSFNENMEVERVEKDNSVNEVAKTDDLHRSVFTNSDMNFRFGWIKVNSTGKGLHLIIPLKLLRINAPIPTIQYHNFFPFKIDWFVTLLVYNDPNATTEITLKNKTTNNYDTYCINGNHSLLLGMFKIPAIGPLRNLLKDGVIDGIQPVQQFLGRHGLAGAKLTPAGILRWIRDNTIGKPFINLSEWEGADEYLRAFGGVVPRYNMSTPVFDAPMINYLKDKFNESCPNLTKMLLFQIQYSFVLYPGYIWNRMPIRTSFLHFKMPQQLIGYTPFVIWNDESPKLLPFVKLIQNIMPDIFYDGS